MKQFAGASNGKKSVTFLHGDHLKYAPPIFGNWADVAGKWLRDAPEGIYMMDGDKISNFPDQWVIAVVTINGA